MLRKELTMSWLSYTSRLLVQSIICVFAAWALFRIGHRVYNEMDQTYVDNHIQTFQTIQVFAGEMSSYAFPEDDIPKESVFLHVIQWLVMDTKEGVLYIFPTASHIGEHFFPFQSRISHQNKTLHINVSNNRNLVHTSCPLGRVFMVVENKNNVTNVPSEMKMEIGIRIKTLTNQKHVPFTNYKRLKLRNTFCKHEHVIFPGRKFLTNSIENKLVFDLSCLELNKFSNHYNLSQRISKKQVTNVPINRNIYFATSDPFSCLPSQHRNKRQIDNGANSNNPPRLLYNLTHFNATFCNIFMYEIPEDLFYDAEDGYTHNLTVSLLTMDGTTPSKSSWVQINSYTIVGTVLLDFARDKLGQVFHYQIVATDSSGLSAVAILHIQLPYQLPRIFYQVNVKVSKFFPQEHPDIYEKLLTALKLAMYFGDSWFDNINLISFHNNKTSNDVTLGWTNCTLVHETCPWEAIRYLSSKLRLDNGTINPRFIEQMRPQYEVNDVTELLLSECAASSSAVSQTSSISASILPSPTDNAPVILTTLPKLNASTDTLFYYVIPNTTFYDNIDGYTNSLTLQLKRGDNTEVVTSSWVQLDAARQELVGILQVNSLQGSTSALFQYVLVARNSRGYETGLNITIEGQSSGFSAGLVLTFTGSISSSWKSRADLYVLVNMFNRLRSYLGDKGIWRIEVTSFVRFSSGQDDRFFLQWANTTFTTTACSVNALRHFLQALQLPDNTVNPKVADALSSVIDLQSILASRYGNCNLPVSSSPSIQVFQTPTPLEAPVIMITLGRLNISTSIYFEYTIPNNLFFDSVDGYTRNLGLELRESYGKFSVGLSSWIQLNQKTQTLYAFLTTSQLQGQSQSIFVYTLVAINSRGVESGYNFTIYATIRTTFWGINITLVGSEYNTTTWNNVRFLQYIVTRLYSYLGSNYEGSIEVIRVQRTFGPLWKFSLTWTITSPEIKTCEQVPKSELTSLLYTKDLAVHPDLKSVMSPYVIFTQIIIQDAGPCLISPSTTPSIPTTITASPTSAPMPVLTEKFPNLTAFTNQYFYFLIPENMFYDIIDGNTRNLVIKMYNYDLTEINSSSWMQFDPKTQTMYGFLYTQLFLTSESITFTYILIVSNSLNYQSRFTINIKGYLYLLSSGMQVVMNMRIFFSINYPDVWIIRQIIFKTQSYLNEHDNNTIQIISWTRTMIPYHEIRLIWASTRITSSECNFRILRNFQLALLHSSGQVSTNYMIALAPSLIVTEVVLTTFGNCKDASTFNLGSQKIIGSTRTIHVPTLSLQTTPTPIIYPPKLNTTVPPIPVEFCKFLYYQIPEDTFLAGNINTRGLSLELLDDKLNPLPTSSWIQFNPLLQVIYGFLKVSDYQSKHLLPKYYVLVATNAAGETSNANISFLLPPNEFLTSYEVTMVTDRYYDITLPDVNEQLLLLSKISTYFGNYITDSIQLISFGVSNDQQRLTTTWTNCSLPYQPCPRADIQRMSSMLFVEPGVPQGSFVNALKHQYKLQGITERILGPCLPSSFSFIIESTTAASSKFVMQERTSTNPVHTISPTKPFFTEINILSDTLLSPIPSPAQTDVSQSSILVNYPPVAINVLLRVVAEVCTPIYYKISEYAFYDIEDGFTRNLRLHMTKKDGSTLDQNSWLQFDTISQTVYGIVVQSDLTSVPREEEYLLTAEDKHGLKAIHILKALLPALTLDPNNVVGMQLELISGQNLLNVDIKLQILQYLVNYIPNSDNSTISFISFTRLDSNTANITLTWTNCTLNTESCDRQGLENLRGKLLVDYNTVNPALSNALLPVFRVKQVTFNLKGNCIYSFTSTVTATSYTTKPQQSVLETQVPTSTPGLINNRPVIRKFLPVLNATTCQFFNYKIDENTFFDTEDGSTSKLQIYFTLEDGSAIKRSSWLQLNASSLTLYGILTDNVFQSGRLVTQNYRLVAVDSGGLSVFQTFTVISTKQETKKSFVVTFQMRYYMSSTMPDTSIIQDLINTLTVYVGAGNSYDIRVIEFKRKSGEQEELKFKWSNCSLFLENCPRQTIKHLQQIFFSSDVLVNIDLVLAFAPKYLVTTVVMEEPEGCSAPSYTLHDSTTLKMSSIVPFKTELVSTPLVLQSTILPDLPPFVASKILPLSASFCRTFSYHVPEDLFYDREDGSTRNLMLTLQWQNGTALPRDSWIQLSGSSQIIYGILKVSDFENKPTNGYRFTLVATDSKGQQASTSFTIEIPSSPPPVNHKITLTLNRFFSSSVPDVDEELLLLTKISNYAGDQDTQKINVILFSRVIAQGNITIVWSNCSLSYQPCPIQEVDKLFNLFLSDNGNTNNAFKSILLPQYTNSTVTTEKLGPCIIHQPTIKPTISPSTSAIFNRPPIPKVNELHLNATFCSVFEYAISDDLFSDEDGSTSQLKLSLTTSDGELLKNDSWILLNQINRTIYGIFKSSDVDNSPWRNFTLSALDTLGMSGYLSLILKVPTEARLNSHEIHIRAISFESVIPPDLDVMLSFRRNLQKVYADAKDLITFNSFLGRSETLQYEYTLSYTNCSFSGDLCAPNDLQLLTSNIFVLPGILNPKFILAFAPNLVVQSASLSINYRCQNTTLWSVPSMAPTASRSISTNSPPVILRKIPSLNVSLCFEFYCKISNDTFYDIEDGYADKLRLVLENKDGTSLDTDSWIVLNQKEMTLRGILKRTDTSMSSALEYRLKATDSSGISISQTITFRVLDLDRRVAYEIKTWALTPLPSSTPSYEILAEFNTKLGNYLGTPFDNQVQIISYRKTNINPLHFEIRWSLCLLDEQPCNQTLFDTLNQKVFHAPNVLTVPFLIALIPNVRIINAVLYTNYTCIQSTNSIRDLTTTTSQQIITPSHTISETSHVNTPPKRGRQVPSLSIDYCKPLFYELSNDTCVDNEDGNILNLLVYLTFMNGSSFPDDFWIQVKKNKNGNWQLRGILMRSHLKEFVSNSVHMRLVCQDSKGLNIAHTLEITTAASDNVNSDVVSVLSYLFVDTSLDKLDIQILWVQKLNSYLKRPSQEFVVFHSFLIVPSVQRLAIFQFSNCSLLEQCNVEETEQLRDYYLGPQGTINNRLVLASIPQFVLVSVVYNTFTTCSSILLSAVQSTLPPMQSAMFSRSPVLSATTSLMKLSVISHFPTYIRKSTISYTTASSYHMSHGVTVTPSGSISISVLIPIHRINVSSCQNFSYTIPEQTFYDVKFGFTRNLTLKLMTKKNTLIDNSSWIQFDASSQTVYGRVNIREFQFVRNQNFMIYASNQHGTSAFSELQVHLIPPFSIPNHEFQTYSYVYSSMMRQTYLKDLITRKLIEYGGKNETLGIQFSSFAYISGKRNQIYFVWSSCQFLLSCSQESFKRFQEKYLLFGTLLSAKFVSALLPELLVTKMQTVINNCDSIDTASSSTVSLQSKKYSMSPPLEFSPSITTSSSEIINMPPQVATPISPISVFLCSQLSYRIPEKTFADPEDGNTRQLKLSLLSHNGTALSRSSWVQFVQSTQVLYGLLKVSDIDYRSSSTTFQLMAEDSKGSKAILDLRFIFPPIPTINFGVETKLERYFDITISDITSQFYLLTQIGRYFKDVSIESVLLLSFDRPLLSTIVTAKWTNCTLLQRPCPTRDILQVTDNILQIDGNINQMFYNALQPFQVKNVQITFNSSCQYNFSNLTPIATNFQDLLTTMVLPPATLLGQSLSSYHLSQSLRPTSSSVIPALKVPKIINPIENLTVSICDSFSYQIPSNVFGDDTDGATRNLQLELRISSNQLIPRDYWLQFSRELQLLYGILKLSDLKHSSATVFNFSLIATNSLGLSTTLKIYIISSTPPRVHNYLFFLQVNKYFTQNVVLFHELFSLREKITEYFSGKQLTPISFVSANYTNSRVNVELSQCILVDSDCNQDLTSRAKSLVLTENGAINEGLQSALLPQYTIYKVIFRVPLSCQKITQLSSISIVTFTPTYPTDTIDAQATETLVRTRITVPLSTDTQLLIFSTLDVMPPQSIYPISTTKSAQVSFKHSSRSSFKSLPAKNTYSTIEKKITLSLYYTVEVPSSLVFTQPSSKSSSIIAMTSSIASKLGPVPKRHIYINASYCDSVNYQVPNDLFEYDDIRSLQLNLQYINGSHLGCESWIHFNKTTRLIYGRPLTIQPPGLYLFLLTASDLQGLLINTTVAVNLMGQTKPNATYRIITSLIINFDKTICSVDVLYALGHKIQTYLGFNNISFEALLRLESPSASVVSFTFCNLRVAPCNFILIQSYYKRIFTGPFLAESKTSSPGYAAALRPEFTVIVAFDQRLGQCEENIVLAVGVHLKTVNVSMCGVLNYIIPAETFYDYEDGNTRNLRLQLTQITLEPIPQTSWLQFDPSRQVVYGIPTEQVFKDQPQGGYSYRLTAYDVVGANASTILRLRLADTVPIQKCYYEAVFNCSTINKTVDTVLKILGSITRQGIDDSLLNIHLISYQQLNNSVKIKWTYCSSDCLEAKYNNQFYNLCNSTNQTILPTKVAGTSRNNKTLIVDISTCNSSSYFLKDISVDENNLIDLILIDSKGKAVKNNSWIYADRKNRKLSAFGTQTALILQSYGRYRFKLAAMYGNGEIQYINISMSVHGSRRVPSFNVTMHLQWIKCQPVVYMVEEFRQAMKVFLNLSASEDLELLTVNVEDSDQCLLSISWTLCGFPSEYCNYDRLQETRKKLKAIDIQPGKNYKFGNGSFGLTYLREYLSESCQNIKPTATVTSLTYNLSLCQNMSYQIPENAFIDNEQGTTSHLRLSLHPKPAWISLSENSKFLKFKPIVDLIRTFIDSNQSLYLQAFDKWNQTAKLRLDIVLPNYSRFQDSIFKIKLISYINIDRNIPDIDEVLQFKESLLTYLGIPSEKGLLLNYKMVGNYPRFINISISFCSVFDIKCNRSLVDMITRKIIEKPSTPQVQLILALAPRFIVTSIESESKGACINQPPVANVSDLRLETNFCSRLQYALPTGIFLDPDSSDSLKYDMLDVNGQELDQKSWIQFDVKNKALYGIPVLHQVLNQPKQTYRYILRATDNKGASTNVTVHISIDVKTRNFSHQVTMIFSDIMKTATSESQVVSLLLYKISSFLENSTVAPLLFSRNIDTSGIGMLIFANCTFDLGYCDHESITKLTNVIMNSDGSPTSSFVKHLSPEFIPLSLLQERKPPCKTLPQNAPVVRRPLGHFNLTLCTTIEQKIPEETFYDQEDGSTSNLFIYLQLEDGSFPSRSSMIQFDIQNKILYIFPSNSFSRSQSLSVQKALLYARDKDGNTVSTPVTFQILNSTIPNYLLIITSNVKNGARETDLTILRSFYTKVIKYLNSTYLRIQQIAIQEYTRVDNKQHALFNFTISICSLPGNYCDFKSILNITSKLITGGGAVSNEFVRSMRPEFNISGVQGIKTGNCVKPKQNTPPHQNASIPIIFLSYCELFYYQIPNNTFLDFEDGNIWNMKLELRQECQNPVTTTSPLQFDKKEKILYANMPQLFNLRNTNKRIMEYCLLAKDSSGMENNVTLIVHLPRRQLDLNYRYHAVVRSYVSTETSQLNLIKTLLNKLQQYLGDTSQLTITKLSVREKYPQLVEFEWSNCTWSNKTCNKAEIKRTSDKLLFGTTKLINPYFIEALTPEIVVLSVTGENTGACNITTNQKPVATRNLSITLAYCQKLRYVIPGDVFIDEEDGTNLTLVLTTPHRNGSLCISNLLLNTTNRLIHNLVYSNGSDQQQKMFVKAIDSQGLFALTPLTVNEYQIPGIIAYQLILTLKTVFGKDICQEFLIKSLAIKLSAYTSISDLILTSFSRDNTSLQLGLSRCKFTNLTCLNTNTNQFRDLFLFDFNIKDSLRQALTPEYTVEDIKEPNLVHCSSRSLLPASTSSVYIDSILPTKSHTSFISTTVSVIPVCTDFNTAPTLVNTMTQIETQSGRPAEYQIPADIAYDKEDGNVLNLGLTLLDSNKRPINNSWIYLNRTTRTLYTAVTEEERASVTDTTYTLRIHDVCGADVYDTFVLKVTNQVSCCNLISMEFNDTKNSEFKSAYERKLLYDKLTSFYGDSKNTLRLYSIVRRPTKQSISVLFTNATGTECYTRDIKELSQPVLNQDGEIREEFLTFFNVPGVLSVGIPNNTFCNQSIPFVPIPPPLIPPVAARVKTDLHWLYWLLPFLIIAALLLLCCLLYYCCKKCEVSKGNIFVQDPESMAAPISKGSNLESAGAAAAVEASLAAATAVPFHFDGKEEESPDPAEEENPYAAIDSLERNQVPSFIPASVTQRKHNYPTAKPLWAPVEDPTDQMIGSAPRLTHPPEMASQMAPALPDDIEDTIIPETRTDNLGELPFFLDTLEETNIQNEVQLESISNTTQRLTFDDAVRTVEMQTDPSRYNSPLRLPGLPAGPPPPYSPPRPPRQYQKLPSYEDATSETTPSERRSKGKLPVLATVPVQFKSVARPRSHQPARAPRRNKKLVLLKNKSRGVRPTHVTVGREPEERPKRRPFPRRMQTHSQSRKIQTDPSRPYNTQDVYPESTVPPTLLMPTNFVNNKAQVMRSPSSVVIPVERSAPALYGYSQQPYVINAVPLQYPYPREVLPAVPSSRMLYNHSPLSFFHDPLVEESVLDYPYYRRSIRYSPYSGRRRPPSMYQGSYPVSSTVRRGLYSPYFGRRTRAPYPRSDDFYLPLDREERPYKEEERKGRDKRSSRSQRGKSIVRRTLDEADRQIEVGSARRSTNRSSDLEDSDEMTERIKTWLRESQSRRPIDEGAAAAEVSVKKAKPLTGYQRNSPPSGSVRRVGKRASFQTKKRLPHHRRRSTSLFPRTGGKGDSFRYQHPLSDLTEVSETKASGNTGNDIPLQDLQTNNSAFSKRNSSRRSKSQDKYRTRYYSKLFESHSEDSF